LPNAGGIGGNYGGDLMSKKVHSWEYMANLTHETQVAEFGFCTCEEQEYFPFDDCPRLEGGN
jgi:hypothetical protein